MRGNFAREQPGKISKDGAACVVARKPVAGGIFVLREFRKTCLEQGGVEFNR